MKVPCLFTTYNRLEYSKKALSALMKSDDIKIIIVDNNSNDGTKEWLQQFKKDFTIIFHQNNLGIAGAMNAFLSITEKDKYISKCDNDTVTPKNWVSHLLKHIDKADIIQCRHSVLKETHFSGFDDWVLNMPQSGALRFNHFVGGSGIVMKRNIIKWVPETEWKLYGFRTWQREHPELKKAFCTDVSIELLDTDERGQKYPEEYKSYYAETKRL